MNVTFRQGIIKHSIVGPNQNFLVANGNTVDLKVTNGITSITFSQGHSNYTHDETTEVIGAWNGTFTANTNYWLYFDINTLTGIRTFGYTEIEPLVSSNKPSNTQTGQHWYNLSDNKMYVFETSVWRNVIRVFACMYDGINLYSMGGGVGSYPFAGSQVGINNVNSFSGHILYDNGKGVLNNSREFYTTESAFSIAGNNITNIKLESTFSLAEAKEPISKYSVVKIVSEDAIELANYEDDEILAIATEDVVLGGITNIIYSGIIVNEQWNWENVGDKLWVNSNGELVNYDLNVTNYSSYPVKMQPVGRVLSSKSILFDPSF